MKNKSIIIFLIIIFTGTVSAAEIIVLNETQEKIFSVEKLILRGDLSKDKLNIIGYGRVISGENVKVYLLGPAQDILINNLRVNNEPRSLSFDSKGYYFLFNKGEFDIEADLNIRTIGQIRLNVPGPVNELKFDIDNGYAIDGDKYGVYNREIIIQRSEKVSMVVEGNFKYSYKQKNEFSYLINFRAFGSTLGKYTLNLKNNEQVTYVAGALKHEQIGNNFVLDLEGKTAAVTIRGYFDSGNLKIPLNEDTHHVVIESEPEKKLSISTNAEEIDLSESTLNPDFLNARAFLASQTDSFIVQVKDLEILPSLAASVKSADQKVAITKKGSVLGELRYNYENTGLDYISIDIPGEPLYASTSGRAVKLTKDKEFLLSFPKSTYGNLDLIFFETVDKLSFFDIVKVPLAKTDLPITEQKTTIFLPEDVFVVETIGAKGGSQLPEFRTIIIFVLLMGALAALVRKDIKFIFLYVIFSSALLIFDKRIFALLITVSMIYKIRQYVSKKSMKYMLAGAGALIVLGLVIFVFFGFMNIFSGVTRQMGTHEMVSDYARVDEEVSSPMTKSMNVLGEGSGKITVQKRKGVLPVRFELPRLGKTITVKNHLVTKETPVNLTLILVSSWIEYLYYIIGIIAGYFCYREL
ncbi:hypothetical protein GF327_09655 [Candidatus Woesearchaeota archaeon]|nr:hypothetical protein [Candidatus Woesearchaeota archaeon]